MNKKISDAIQQKVRQRALELCEYCHASEKWQYVLFTVDHVISLSKNGQDTIDNLALACFHCNRKKSNNTTAIDPETGNEVELFNPRKNKWSEHFIWSKDGLKIINRDNTHRKSNNSKTRPKQRQNHQYSCCR